MYNGALYWSLTIYRPNSPACRSGIVQSIQVHSLNWVTCGVSYYWCLVITNCSIYFRTMCIRMPPATAFPRPRPSSSVGGSWRSAPLGGPSSLCMPWPPVRSSANSNRWRHAVGIPSYTAQLGRGHGSLYRLPWTGPPNVPLSPQVVLSTLRAAAHGASWMELGVIERCRRGRMPSDYWTDWWTVGRQRWLK